jgi:uncharacterized protein YjbJ (UPF0337 family)
MAACRSLLPEQQPQPSKQRIMKTSTQDKVEGTAKEMKGKVQETAGRAVGNPDLEERGMDKKVEGKVQKKVGDIKKVFDK